MRISMSVCLLGLLSVEAKRQQKVVGTPFVGDHADAHYIVENDRVTAKLSLTEANTLRDVKVNESFKKSQQKERSATIPKFDEYFQVGSVFETSKGKRLHTEVQKLMANEKAKL
mmetsp:Transcript_47719/g.64748  ORF Transcript_47719/g.64748 Transcript_47719/m.64748 type:complete len:114 (+) Transcript_47719:37-378(+)